MTDGYLVCYRAEDPVCSQTCIDPIDPNIHRQYFNTSLSEWPKLGCPRTPSLLELATIGQISSTILMRFLFKFKFFQIRM
jgi:hypothetical protein